MNSKEIKINDRTFVVKEILYKESVKIGKEYANDSEQLNKQLLMLSTGLTSEEYETLSMKDGIALQTVFNDVNGLNAENFQKRQS